MNPEFGHAMLKYWSFDPEYLNLNNGSVGAAPRPVLDACRVLAAEIEANPDLFHRHSLYPRLFAVRERLAHLLGAQTDEIVLVPNTSHGLNTVLRNFEWEKGDVLVTCTTTYKSISHTVQYLSDRPPHPTVSVMPLVFPISHAAILDRFRAHLRSLNAARAAAGGRNKTVAVIDGITANPGVYMPWKEMVKICREEGVWSVVDAAHAIGQELDIELGRADPDFWVSNCHKWMYAKRPCAVLYVPKRNQHVIKSTIPTSHMYNSPTNGTPPPPLWQQFEWNGMIDYTPFLSVAAALDFRAYLGGEERINAYCRKLAREGGNRLAEILGTEVMSSINAAGKDELTLNMVNVRLPISDRLSLAPAMNEVFIRKVLIERKISAWHYLHHGRWWVRACAQVWNEIQDFEKLGKAYLEVCMEIEARPELVNGLHRSFL